MNMGKCQHEQLECRATSLRRSSVFAKVVIIIKLKQSSNRLQASMVSILRKSTLCAGPYSLLSVCKESLNSVVGTVSL